MSEPGLAASSEHLGSDVFYSPPFTDCLVLCNPGSLPPKHHGLCAFPSCRDVSLPVSFPGSDVFFPLFSVRSWVLAANVFRLLSSFFWYPCSRNIPPPPKVPFLFSGESPQSHALAAVPLPQGSPSLFQFKGVLSTGDVAFGGRLCFCKAKNCPISHAFGSIPPPPKNQYLLGGEPHRRPFPFPCSSILSVQFFRVLAFFKPSVQSGFCRLFFFLPCFFFPVRYVHLPMSIVFFPGDALLGFGVCDQRFFPPLTT